MGGRENARKKKGRISGVKSSTWEKQHGKFIDEVNKPRSST